MSKYAWYTRITDAAHRLTVLTLISGTLYLSGGLVYNLIMNRRRHEEPTIKDKEEITSA